MIKENSIVDISVIIPTRNEEKYIENCMKSLLNCRSIESDSFNVQFIIVDGMSTDKTIKILEEKFGNLNINIFKNPNLYQSYAMNIGIKNSKFKKDNSIIIRADAHSIYPENYIFKCWQALFDSGGGNAGPIQRAVGTNFFTKVVADVMNSGYAMGGVNYRKIKYDPLNSEKYLITDTVYLGSWRTLDLLKFRGFNEEFQINEDYELNIRLRKNGKKVILITNLIVDYFVRSNLMGLIKQFFRYGLWKTKTLSVHPESIKLRQLAPVLFVLFIFSVGISNIMIQGNFLIFLNLMFGFISFLWLLLILLIWSKSSSVISIFLIPLIVLSMHISWGLGFLYGLSRWLSGRWNKQ
tara:strand:- start:353 stop:1408 length:1056 start_codon:yes stop_codon:yes gene_type:complete